MDKRLHHKQLLLLLLALILGMGILSDKTAEALECYNSTFESYHCGEDFTYCAKSNEKQYCSSSLVGSCVEKHFPSGGCFFGTEENLEKLRNCSGVEPDPAQKDPEALTCYCRTDNCNNGTIEEGKVLKCFDSNTASNKDSREIGTTSCLAENEYCYEKKAISKDSSIGADRMTTKGCASSIYGECAMKLFTGNCYLENEKNAKKWKECIGIGNDSLAGELEVKKEETCYCNKDLCNTDNNFIVGGASSGLTGSNVFFTVVAGAVAFTPAGLMMLK